MSRRAVPFTLLSQDSAWDGKRQWQTFCSATRICPSEAVLFVKINEEDRATAQLGIVQPIGGSLWALGKLSKSARIRDIKSIEDKDGMETCEQGEALLPGEGILETFFRRCTLEPAWNTTGRTGSRLELTPSGARTPGPAKKIAPVLVEERDPLQFLRTRYMQALYDPKELLAYFAKSVVSRVRSLCKESSTGNKKAYVAAATSVFWSRVADWATLDARYDRLWPDELDAEHKEYRERWHATLTELERADVAGQLRDLKARETQLMVVLLLETLAMQRKYGDDTKTKDETAAEPQQAKPKPKPKAKPGLVRKKKKAAPAKEPVDSAPETTERNGPSAEDLLEMLFDRLCIWQTVSEEIVAATDRQQNGSADSTGKLVAPKDKVLQFCKDVVLPFYGSRLPDKTKELARKARGLSGRAARHHSAPPVSQRDDPVDPVEPVAPSQTLSQSLSQSQSQALSQGPASDDLHKPAPRLATKTHSRGGIQAAKSTQQQRRQVEVSFAAAPIRKEHLQEELETAIKAISKPNRMLATRELSGMRKPFPPARSKSQPVVHVAATPVARRSVVLPHYTEAETSVISTPSARREKTVASPVAVQTPAQPDEPEAIASSSPLAVRTPSTGSKRRAPAAFSPHITSPIARRKLDLGASRVPLSPMTEDPTN